MTTINPVRTLVGTGAAAPFSTTTRSARVSATIVRLGRARAGSRYANAVFHRVVPRALSGNGAARKPDADDVLEREAPGISEHLRSRGLLDSPLGHLSRSRAGLPGACPIVTTLPPCTVEIPRPMAGLPSYRSKRRGGS